MTATALQVAASASVNARAAVFIGGARLQSATCGCPPNIWGAVRFLCVIQLTCHELEVHLTLPGGERIRTSNLSARRASARLTTAPDGRSARSRTKPRTVANLARN